MGHRRHHVVYFAIVAVVVSVSIAVGVLYCGIRYSVTAERSLHATLLVVDLVREYVIYHQGVWPRSWQDLERLPPRQRAMFRWPADREAVRRYVSVDFRADPKKLATESVEQFVAVQPRGPCYPYKHYPEIAKLLDAIRKTRHSGLQTPP